MKKTNNEVSQILRTHIDDVSEELQTLIPDFDMMKPIPDEKIKTAILNITPQGLQYLNEKFGADVVTEYLNEFTRGRRW